MENLNEPLVSIGIPTYNRPKTLYKTLESITKQTYQNIEIIVSDNCSPDNETETVVRDFMKTDDRIHFYRQSSNIGMFNNFKFVLQVSKGDYFCWAADDDSRSYDFIEACVNKFNEMQDLAKTSNLILVNSYSELIDPVTENLIAVDKGCTTIGFSAEQRYRRYIDSIFKEQAWVGDLIYGLIKRDAADKAMLTQPNILGWDHIFLANLALQGEFYTIPKSMMRSSPGGISTTDDDKMARSQLIEGSFSHKKRGWVRELYLQRCIRDAEQVSSFRKMILSAWSYNHYMKTRGMNNIARSFFPEGYETLKILFGPNQFLHPNQISKEEK